MKILVIGGTGHIGAFLTRMLVEDGHQVAVASSGRTPVPVENADLAVKYHVRSYHESMADGSFASLLQEERPEVVVDILQGDSDSVYEACRQAGVAHLVNCGSVWMWGRPKVVPTPEIPQTECPFEGYKRRLADMQQVIARSGQGGLAVTGIMPPNICGPRKIPLDGQGGRSLQVHEAHRRGEEVVLPYPGTNLIGPCDAEDVARGFFCAIGHREQAAGEIFNVGSAYALTAEKFIATYGEIYGVTIPIRYVSPETFETEIMPEAGANFHFLEHMCPDLTKIRERLGYRPAYTPEETMERAVRWMFDAGLLRR
jgi:nucleoside-diphosphate-sugar epimerase